MYFEDWKREISNIFFARSKIIGWTTLIVFVCSLAITLLWPPTYLASGSVLVRAKRAASSPTSLEGRDFRNFPVTTEDMASEAEVLRSGELIRRTVQQVRKEDGKGEMPEDSLKEEIREIKMDKLTTEIILSSHVIRVLFRARDPNKAERMLDILLENYIPYRSSVFHPGGEGPFLAQRAKQYREELEKHENELLTKVKKGSATSLETEMEGNLEIKRDLMSRLITLRDEYTASKLISNAELEARMKLLQMSIKDLEERNEELQRQLIELQRITREMALLQFSYETFAKRSEEADINNAIGQGSMSSDVSVLSRGAFSAERVFPKLLLTPLLGLIAGFIAGCSLGFVAEFLDHTFKRPGDVAQYANLPLICSISKS